MIRYDGDRSIAGNPVMANYEMEDAAARLLYEAGQSMRSPRPTDAMRLAEYLGASVRTVYLSDSPYSLCAVATEPQTLRIKDGKAIVMAAGDIFVERAIVDRDDTPWYNYAVFHALAHLYLHNESGDERQLSFDLSGTQSEKHFVCDAGELSDVYSDDRLDSRPASEAQADAFAGCLMLPKVPFKMAVNKQMNKLGINRTDLSGKTLDKILRSLAKTFCAPEIVIALRLKKLLYL